MLVDQPVEDPFDRMPLFTRRVQIGPQHLIDQRRIRIQPARTRRHLLPRLRPRRRQRFLHRPETNPELSLHCSVGHALPGGTADRRIQLELGHRRHGRSSRRIAPRCSHHKPPSAVKTQQHHPTPTTPAAAPNRQTLSKLTYKTIPRIPAAISPGRHIENTSISPGLSCCPAQELGRTHPPPRPLLGEGASFPLHDGHDLEAETVTVLDGYKKSPNNR
jgi:hypothetical protein